MLESRMHRTLADLEPPSWLPMCTLCFHMRLLRMISLTSFATASTVPFQNKGDTSDPDNYRGIAVGNVLGKGYNSVMNRRLSKWALAHGLRRVGQAGFMEGLGTSQHQFIMRHLVTRYSTKPLTARQGRRCGPGLFVCQVDFSKAFDKVPRGLLWERLQERGVHGHMLN